MTPFFMAWSMFCSIPCPSKKWDPEKTRQMLMCLPFVGLLIGIIWFAVRKITVLLGLGIPGAVLTAVLPWTLTGFMHLDGFMDCSDAVLSYRDRERRIEILKDSHVGSFAVICMVILAMFTLGAWLQIGYRGKGFVLMFIPVATRCISAASVLGFKPLKTSSYAKTAEEAVPVKSIAFCIAVLLAACIAGFAVSGKEGIAVPAAALCSMLTVLRIRANLGGMSGDISGAAITVGECCGIIVLALTLS